MHPQPGDLFMTEEPCGMHGLEFWEPTLPVLRSDIKGAFTGSIPCHFFPMDTNVLPGAVAAILGP